MRDEMVKCGHTFIAASDIQIPDTAVEFGAFLSEDDCEVVYYSERTARMLLGRIQDQDDSFIESEVKIDVPNLRPIANRINWIAGNKILELMVLLASLVEHYIKKPSRIVYAKDGYDKAGVRFVGKARVKI